MKKHFLFIFIFCSIFCDSSWARKRIVKKQAKPVYLIADSIGGELFLGDSLTMDWKPLRVLPVRQSFRIKTGDSGYIRLAFPDGSFFSLGPKSRMNVSNSKMDADGHFVQSIDIAVGEGLLLKEKKESLGKFKLSPICFPMGCADTEHGSMIIEAKYTGERTDVMVLKGFARVYQSQKKAMFLTKEEYFISLKRNGLVEGPLLFDEEMLTEIYPWVDKKIIDDEIYEGRLARRFKRELLWGQNVSNILFLDFVQEGRVKKEWDVSEFVSRFIFRSLKNQQGVNVSRATPQDGMSSLKLGKRLLADKVVEGVITHFELTRSARFREKEERYELVPKALVKIQLKIWDVHQSAIVYEKNIDMEKYGQPDQVEFMKQVLDGPLEVENQSVQRSPIWGVMQTLSQNVEDIILSF